VSYGVEALTQRDKVRSIYASACAFHKTAGACRFEKPELFGESGNGYHFLKAKNSKRFGVKW
jgi:hypothetical protein